MTNRKKYITKRNEYDLLCDIRKYTHTCPVFAVSGDHPQGYHLYGCAQNEEKCNRCIQTWLNKEENHE